LASKDIIHTEIAKISIEAFALIKPPKINITVGRSNDAYTPVIIPPI
jgi:hypothetical protein